MKTTTSTKLILTLSLFFAISVFPQSDSTAKIWVSRSVAQDTIYYEGAPDSSIATVSLKAWASGDSIFTGQPIDVAILTDNSSSMSQRTPGTRDWIPPISRIQGTYNASVNFIDSFMNTNDRIAHLRFCRIVDTPYAFSTNFSAVKARMDTTIDGTGRVNGVNHDGTALWTGILTSIRYVMANRRPGIQPVIIALTDGADNASGSYGSYWRSWMPNLGSTQTRAVDSVVKVLDSIRNALGPNAIKVFTINLGVTTGSTYMQRIAAAGNGSWAYSATGTDLDSIFQNIGQRLSDVVGRSISPGVPVLIDVLGPGIHYVPGSFSYRTGIGFVTPSFNIDTVNGFTRLSFGADTIRLEHFLDIQYQITASMSKPDIFKDSLMRTNNTFGDAANYSLLQYKDIKDTVISRPIERNWVSVKSGISGLFLSESLSTIAPPSATKLIPLIYSYSTPAVYPSTTLFSILRQQATNVTQLTSVSAQWFFQPNAGWTAPHYNGIQAAARDVEITVPYNYADQDTLSIQFSHRGRTFSDYLVFSSSDSSTAEYIVGIAIDNDTIQPGFINPPRLVITGNRSQLNSSSFSVPLFSRAITNRNNVLPIASTWSIEQFNAASFYLSPIFQGTHTQRTLSFNLPEAGFTQSDSGIIRITDGSFTFALYLVIRDTTNYDTTDVVAIYNNFYNGYSPTIEAAYQLQMSNTSMNAFLGDTITLYALRFDSNGAAINYLGMANATWQINGGTPTIGPQINFTSQNALQTDRITVTYVNEWGRTLTSTFTINWGFGRERYLFIESQPGELGSSAQSPLDSISIQAGATDTIRGIYAVIRDEYGFCVDDGNSTNSTIWGFGNPAALTYLSIPGPTDSTTACWIYKKESPAEPTAFFLTANGLQSAGIEGKKDSLKVRLVNYNYSHIEIVAGGYFQGFVPGDIIPRNTVLQTGCDRSVRVYVHAIYNDSMYDIKPVFWSNSAASAINPEANFFGVYYSISPIAYSPLDTVFAHFITDNGVSIFDTLLFSVDYPTTASVRIDTSKGTASGVRTVEVVGNLSQLRSKTIRLYSFAKPTCPQMPEQPAFGAWSSTVTDPWIVPFVNKNSTCSLVIPLSAIPVSKGNHSLTGTILFRDLNLTDIITIRIVDTTDYDTLDCLIPDTTTIPSVTTFDSYLQKRFSTTYTMRAGDTINLLSRFYDINAIPNNSGLIPKYVGTDTVRWEIRTGVTSPSFQIGSRLKHTRTVSGTIDTIVVTYPSALRANLPAADYPIGVSELSHKVIVHWIPAAANNIRLSLSDLPSATPLLNDTITLSDTEDSVTLYAIVYDYYGNVVSNADKQLWSTDSATWLDLPTTETHIGTIVRKAAPPFLALFRVEALLPGNSYLGSGIYSPLQNLTTYAYIKTGNFTIDQLSIISGSAQPLQTTLGRTINAGDSIENSDTLLVQSCDETVTLQALVHSTNPALGNNGWFNQAIQWIDTISTSIASNYNYSPDNSFRRFFVKANHLSFSKTIHFKILPEYARSLSIIPTTNDKRFVVEGDTTRIRQASLQLTARLTTNCGRSVDTTVQWSTHGFSFAYWLFDFQYQLGSAQSSSKMLSFTAISRDTLPQSDSGYIVITYTDNASYPVKTFRDTVKLVIKDITDYDTVDVVALVPYTTYRETVDKDGLYDAYNSARTLTVAAGDNLQISPLLYDINANGMKYIGIGKIPGRNYYTEWFLNGVQQFRPDTLFSYIVNTVKTDTIVSVVRGGDGHVIASDTMIINWTPGRGRHIHLESQPGATNVPPSPIDTLVMTGLTQSDTIYAVIRDEFYNFVSNAKVTRWTMTPASYYNYLQIPPANYPTNEGTLLKLSSPETAEIFAFIGRIERNTEIAGIIIGTVSRDTTFVKLSPYDYSAISLVSATTNIEDTNGTKYGIGASIPSNTVLKLTALEDPITVRALLLRNDTTAWESQPVSWRVSGSSVQETILPTGTSASLTPLRASISPDTLFALKLTANGDTLTDTICFIVEPPWIDTIIIVYNGNPTAGDTVTITIILLDKAGDTIKDISRLPDTFAIEIPGNMIIVDTAAPYPGGTTVKVVPIVTGPDTMIIAIPVPIKGGGMDTIRDTIVFNITPSRPDSIAIIKTAGGDTLIAAGNDLSISSATVEIRIFDQYGNLIPASSPIYDSILIVLSGVIDSTDTIRTGRNAYTITVQGNTQSGTGLVHVSVPASGGYLRDTLAVFVSAAIQILSLSTHEWVPDTNDLGTIRQVIMSVLNLDPDSIIATAENGQSGKLRLLHALNNGGFPQMRDGYLDYLSLVFSAPVELNTQNIKDISFKAGIQRKADTEWRLTDSATNRSIYLEPLDAPVNGKHKNWHIWLITNADRSHVAALETGYQPAVTFMNNGILIGDGRPFYTYPSNLVIDSAAPVISKALFRNNACDKANPNNALVITFSEPILSANIPQLAALTAFSLFDGNTNDSLFIRSMALSVNRIDFVDDNRLAWNYSGELEKAMALQISVDRTKDSRLRVGRSKVRFSVNSTNKQVVDVANNSACKLPSRAVTIQGDIANSSFLCSVSGLNEVNRDDARWFGWSSSSSSSNGEQYPLFPYFGFSINMDEIVNRSRLVQFGSEVLVGTKRFVIFDLDSSISVIISEVKIFDLIGNLTADPTTHTNLRNQYTLKSIRKYLNLLDYSSPANLTEAIIEQNFDIVPASNNFDPDTLIPRYPATLPIDYEFMVSNCGAGTGTPCIPAWNCYNHRGRLVSPGGYIAIQKITTPAGRQELTRRLIVKGGTSNENSGLTKGK